MIRAQLKKFIEVRNESRYNSNLQFQIDANECGFHASDLGKVKVTEDGYQWDTPYGLLVESGCNLTLEVYPSPQPSPARGEGDKEQEAGHEDNL